MVIEFNFTIFKITSCFVEIQVPLPSLLLKIYDYKFCRMSKAFYFIKSSNPTIFFYTAPELNPSFL